MKVCSASSSLRQSLRLCWRHFLWQHAGSPTPALISYIIILSLLCTQRPRPGIIIGSRWRGMIWFLTFWITDVWLTSQQRLKTSINPNHDRLVESIQLIRRRQEQKNTLNLVCLLNKVEVLIGILPIYTFTFSSTQNVNNGYVSWSITNNKHCSVNLAPTAMTTQSILQRAMSKIGLCQKITLCPSLFDCETI